MIIIFFEQIIELYVDKSQLIPHISNISTIILFGCKGTA